MRGWINRKASQHKIIYRELEEIVGSREITDKEVDKIVYSADYFWVPEILVTSVVKI